MWMLSYVSVFMSVCKSDAAAVHFPNRHLFFESGSNVTHWFGYMTRVPACFRDPLASHPQDWDYRCTLSHTPFHTSFGDPSSCLHMCIQQLPAAWSVPDFNWVPFECPHFSSCPCGEVLSLVCHTSFATVCQDLSFCKWCLTATPRSRLRMFWVRSGKKHLTEKTRMRFISTTSPALEWPSKCHFRKAKGKPQISREPQRKSLLWIHSAGDELGKHRDSPI